MTRTHATLVLGLTLLLTGCGPTAGGRVTLGGDPGQSCVSVRSGGTVLIGEVVSVLTAQVRVSAVELSDAAAVRVVDRYVLPVAGDVIGTSDFPPADTPSWRQRRPAAGAQLEPGSSYNVVARVARTGASDGAASAIRIDYLTGTSRRSVQGTTTYTFADRCF